MNSSVRSRRVAALVAGSALALAASLFLTRDPREAAGTASTAPAADAAPGSSMAVSEDLASNAFAGEDETSTSPGIEPLSAHETSATWSLPIEAVLPDLAPGPMNWREFQPEQLRLAVLPELPVTFTMKSFVQEDERSTWVGVGDVEGATLVAIGTSESWTASVSFADGNEYLVTVDGRQALVQETNPDVEACGNRLVPYADIHQLTDDDVAAPAGAAALAADAVHTADVLILYDEATEARVKADLDRNGMTITPSERIDSVVRTTIGQANEDLARSGIANFRWSVAGVAKVPAYDIGDDTSMRADLNAITYTTSETGRFARARAVELGADKTVLFVSGERDFAGLAWSPGHHSVCLWGSSHYIVAHEMGHNLDCNHDRVTAGAADGGDFNFGHRFTATNGRDSGTIMSYAGSRLPYFSSPDVSYQGAALGVAAGEAKAADNARRIRENAAAMASYRAAVNAPEITRQPVGASLAVGRSLSLSVVASGGNLTFQWRKDGADIAGATSDAYLKEGVVVSDAGNYTVQVANPKGSVVSEVAAVTVSAGAPPSGGGGGGAEGGSGGGGAPSVAFLGALALLAGLRALQRRRSGSGPQATTPDRFV